MARLLIGVSGGIAAYKALELARLAIKAGHSVRVIQTEASLQFVGLVRGDHRSARPRE
jgi:phosphopantothenoylcysteine decarboxylase/phosphopantothenate--cysteine ligase